MTNQQLTPTEELLNQWCYASSGDWREIAAIAARWGYKQGADEELEACCKWLPKLPPWSADDLRRHRRPKPPSLKERLSKAIIDGDEREALKLLEALDD